MISRWFVACVSTPTVAIADGANKPAAKASVRTSALVFMVCREIFDGQLVGSDAWMASPFDAASRNVLLRQAGEGLGIRGLPLLPRRLGEILRSGVRGLLRGSQRA